MKTAKNSYKICGEASHSKFSNWSCEDLGNNAVLYTLCIMPQIIQFGIWLPASFWCNSFPGPELQCFHKSSMKVPFLSVKFPFFQLNFLAKITKFPFKFPSYSETSRRLWRRLRINNLYSGASSLMRLCLKCKDVEHTGS
jgi:hypothetical protein